MRGVFDIIIYMKELPKILTGNEQKNISRKDFLKTLVKIGMVLAIPEILSACDLLPAPHPRNLESNINPEMQKEFNEQRKFMINWYSNRVIQDVEFQKKFEEIKPHILKNLEKVYLEPHLPKGVSIDDVDGQWRNDTIFVNPQRDPQYSTTYSHELGHDAFPVKYNKETFIFDQEMPKWMINLINNYVEESRIDDRYLDAKTARAIENRRQSFEVYSSICSLRELYNFLPDQVISESDLEIVYSENDNYENKIVKNQDVNKLIYIY